MNIFEGVGVGRYVSNMMRDESSTHTHTLTITRSHPLPQAPIKHIVCYKMNSQLVFIFFSLSLVLLLLMSLSSLVYILFKMDDAFLSSSLLCKRMFSIRIRQMYLIC
jgi:type IV secretory pathway VirB3-like protein